MAEWMILIAVFLLGLAVGSFLNVVIHRTPRGENIAWPGSHCPKCGHALRWVHNIPLLSWLLLKGRCAFCGEAISFRYPLIELLNALLWAILWLRTGSPWEFLFIAATFSALLALTAIDFEYFAVPDSVNFFALATALLASVARSIQTGEWGIALDAFRDAAIAAGGLWLLAWLIGKATKKEAMGGADVIVAGTMAALLGLPGFFVALFTAAVLAIVPSLLAKDTMVPFVPFLAMGTLIVYLFQQPIMQALEHYIYG
jgi:leader peptidase (prepilin peptidase)/N-methyltransferase